MKAVTVKTMTTVRQTGPGGALLQTAPPPQEPAGGLQPPFQF